MTLPMKILVINSGSSSLKFQLYGIHNMHAIAVGLIEQIGESNSQISMNFTDDSTKQPIKETQPITDHKVAFTIMLTLLKEHHCLTDVNEIFGIGHRVVHGGETFHKPVFIDDNVCTIIKELSPLAPLHNPANLIGINLIREKEPTIPQVAVFDTAFHQTIPPHSYTYGLPYKLYEQNHVRRYGFHGTSYSYVIKQAALHLGKNLAETKFIALHLGNGTSIAAIEYGKSIDTSMGMTPIEGLLMGTRCGDIDAGILFYLARETEHAIQDLDDLVNKQSGLKGICGENDMRIIIEKSEQGDARAKLALDVFCYRIKKYIGSYLASLNGVDAIIFTGGIGENASLVRELSCNNLESLGIKIDPSKNNKRPKDQAPHEIQADTDSIKILVIPTNEELEIATQTLEHIQHYA